jgi:hypothetical protein
MCSFGVVVVVAVATKAVMPAQAAAARVFTAGLIFLI